MQKNELKSLLSTYSTPLIIQGAATSTVTDVHNLDGYKVISVQKMDKRININGNQVTVRGPVSWKDLEMELQGSGLALKTYPTEMNAHVLAGLATSATGEHAFHYGSLKEQVVEVQVIDGTGVEHNFKREILLEDSDYLADKNLLGLYQQSFGAYLHLKNGPFPRLVTECDLAIGFEGQLGVITQASLELAKKVSTSYFFIRLPAWDKNYSTHLKLFAWLQTVREKVLAAELIDSHSLEYSIDESLEQGSDYLFLEIDWSYFDSVIAELVAIEGIEEDQVFEIGESRFHKLRESVPQGINEHNSLHGIVKKGTDTQLLGEGFEKLLAIYKQWSELDIDFALFGHFGDGHLHFNFLPTNEQQDQVDALLEQFYIKVLALGGSPFAEHGVGLLKQRYIRPFYGEIQYAMFSYLKEQFDPKGILFPEGFMRLA